MTLLDRYVTAVVSAGFVLLGFGVAHGALPPGADVSMVAIFAAALVVAECLPMRLLHDASEGEITMSSTFALALLVVGGASAAMCAIAIGALCSDALRRKPAQRMAFNIGQYELSVAAGAAALALVSGSSFWAPHELVPSLLPAMAAAAVVFFLVNSMLVARAVTLVEGAAFWGYLRRDLALQTSTVGILLGLAPIVVITAEFSLWALPLLGLPLFAVNAAGRQAIANQRQALHDALTKLPNRTLFEERLDQALRLARRGGEGLTVMLIDLDRFKEINDTLGHHEGDGVLQSVATRLVDALRESDTVARFGGDEFVILLPELADEAAVVALAQKLAGAVEQPLGSGERVLQVGASIGVARYPADGEDARTLLRRADVAMYRAKHARERYRLYDAAEDPHSPERLQLASDLHQAVQAGSLEAHFQPKVRLSDGRIEGMEVLMRWPHDDRGIVSPEEFIPIAEDCGLIVPVTTIALEAAMRECRAWLDEGVSIRFAVNVSARSLIDGRIIEQIRGLLHDWRLPGSLLQLELTESMLVDDPAGANKVLQPLREMGVSFALDDFGTGWSSLGQLNELPFDELKIDRSFVLAMRPGSAEDAIVRSTIQLGRELGLRIVAEGVEDETTRARLADLGCDAAQGFLFAAAGPPGAIAPGTILGTPPLPGAAFTRLAA
jgi:diguanylate cyclase (GGDEF)-like protein